jgi:predicted metalloprotease with PDZ domain
MLKSLFLTGVVGGAIFSGAVFAQDNCGGAPIRYDISHGGGTTFNVQVEFGATQGQFDISWRPAEGTEDGLADFINDLQARDSSGVWRAAEYAGHGTWMLPGADTAGYDAVRYQLLAEHDRAVWDIGKEEIAYSFDDAFYFVGQPVLAADYGWMECQFEVSFHGPADWSTVAAWPQRADGVFVVDGMRPLLRNIFVTGPGLEPHAMRIGDMDVVFLEQDGLRLGAPVFQSLLDDSLGRYVDLFGAAPMDRYLVVFGEGLMNDGGAFANSFGQRMLSPLRMSEKLMWARTLAHEALHAWIGITIRPENGSDLQWFTEGGADYLTSKTLYRAGQIDENDLIFITEGQVRRFLLGRISSGEIGLIEAGVEKQTNRQLVYGGGALFHLFLDAQMTAQNGAGSYEAMLRQLYENSEQPYSVERLMAAMDLASSGAASEIYAFLNAPFNPNAIMTRMRDIGLPTAAFGPDELLVRFGAGECEGSREAECVPSYLAR